MNRKEIENELIQRAWADESFKRDLLENPKKVLEAEVSRVVEGFQFPDTMQVRVIEETPGQIVIVLPVNPASVSQEMKDEDLARVSGGTGEGSMMGVSGSPVSPKGMGGFGITIGPSPVAW